MEDQKKAIIIALVALVAIASFIVFDYSQKKESQKQCVPQNSPLISSNILSLTQPITSFSGYVDKIEGKNITLKQNQQFVQSTQPTPLFPTPTQAVISYKVTVSEKTRIVRPAISIYLFKEASPSARPAVLTLKDIQVGDFLTAESKSDLRTFVGSQFETGLITIAPKTHIYTGKIQLVEGNTLSMRVFLPDKTTGAYKKKEPTFQLTDDTEISYIAPGDALTPIKAVKLKYSDLRFQMQVTVYTDSEYEEGRVPIVLRIIPEIGSGDASTP